MEKNETLPGSWVLASIEQLSSNIQYGYTESAKKEPIGPKFLRITDIQGGRVEWDSVPYCKINDDDYEKYHLQSGDIVFARTGATTGKSYLITNPPNAVFASYLIRLKLVPKINPEYVSLFFESKSYWSQIMRVRKGSAQPGVNAKILATIKIPIPPFFEQKRIVAKIEDLFTQLDAGVAELQKAKVQLKRYRQAVLKAAVEGELTHEWREAHQDELEPASELLERILAERRAKWEEEELVKMHAKGKEPKDDRWKRKYQEHEKPKIYGLPELPEGWAWVELGEIIEPSTEKINPQDVDKVPYIGLEHIEKGTGKLLRHGYSNEVRSTKSVFHTGDLLYGKLRPYLNKVLIAEFEGISSTDILVYTDYPHIVNKFLKYRFLSLDFVNFATKNMTGVQHPRVNAKIVANFLIALPSLDEQKYIVEKIERRLSVATDIENQIEHNLVRAKRLRESILHKAFDGKLVEQLSDDGSAAELLAKIKMDKVKKFNEPKKNSIHKESTISGITEDNVIAAISQMPNETFSFDDLYETIPGDYEELKSILTYLLTKDNPSLIQVFDSKSKTLQFKRILK